MVQFEILRNSDEQNGAIQLILIGQSADNYLQEIVVTNQQNLTSETLWMLFYGCVSMFLLLSLFYSLHKIYSIVQTHTVNILQNIKFINTEVKEAPFSFLNYIFWKREISLQTETGQQIFQHELVHVQEKHTLDKLLMEVVIALFWCNPFFWLIRKELKYIHEFIADKKAVGESGAEAFAAMILQSVYPQRFQSITNQFFQTSIKRRLFMLTKLKNPKVAYFSRVIALPLIAILILSFTIRTKENSNPAISFEMTLPFSTDTLPRKAENISAIDVNKQKGEITIRYKDGSSETLTEKQAQEKGLISKNGAKQSADQQKTGMVIKSEGAQPLFVVDGKEVSKVEIDKLDPNTIQSVDVLKDDSAKEKYGEKGKNGVIIITTKKQNTNKGVTIKINGTDVKNSDSSKVTISSDQFIMEADEITVVGFKRENKTDKSGPVFEKTEFQPSVDAEEWKTFLQKNLKPVMDEAEKNGISNGKFTVQVRFVVEKDGSLSDITIVKDPGYGIGSKVLEIMKNAPKFKPAIQNQLVVRSYFTQPITLVFNNNAEITSNQKTSTNHDVIVRN
ncbi:MAG TPA: M56 family metallopeptidase [Flavisolibacter sp.]|nr:M56 family metallopeptidase [Flavisolibacter sp.]